MSTDPAKAKTIFLQAVERHEPSQWDAFLDEACGDSPELRREVEVLLAAHANAGAFLENGAVAPDATLDQPITERAGSRIDRYKLLEKIGEGGFGVVFMAEQEEPVRRKVALKVIKPGMDTKDVIARFEAERQALAMMDHPNIAKVLDGGATESGRPYFVMELVRGIPITDYCDENKLTTRERLELFTSVCRAVQHAHQKGIIHRDIKPSNVMVTMRDDTPVAKVIDFGVAKATNQRLTEKTLFTRYSQMIGTPLYMSPEQAQMNEWDVDTRSDIYSLGVLLYELLSGTTPFDRERMRRAAYDELLKIIREEEPPKPSMRISTLGDSATDVSAQRKSDPKKLSAVICGELDWIVMKALEKDRKRRYETANGFAEDVQRYLNDEAVQACPPSFGYRFKKFARRNKPALVTASVVAAALVLGLVGTTWQAIRVMEEEERTEAQRDRAIQAEAVARWEAEQARQSAEREKQLAERERIARRDAQQHLYDARMSLVRSASEQGQRERVLELLNQCQPNSASGDGEFRSFEWYYRWRQCHRYSWSFSRGEERTTDDRDHVAVSPDGRTAVIARELWNLDTGERIGTLYYDGEEESNAEYAALEEAVRLDPDDEKAKEAKDAAWRERAWKWDTDAIRFSPDGAMVAAKTHDPKTLMSTIHVFNVASLEQTRTITFGVGEGGFMCHAMEFSPDGQLITAVPYIVALNVPQEIFVWEVATGEVRFSVKPNGERCPGSDQRKTINYTRRLAFSRDGAMLATGGYDEKGASRTQLWDISTGDCVKTLWSREGQSGLGHLLFLPDGNRLLARSRDGEITVWDLATGEIDASAPTQVHGGISPCGRTAISHGDYGAMELWDVDSGESTAALLAHSDSFASGLSLDGKRLVTVDDEENEVRIWDLRTDRLSQDFSLISDVSTAYGYSLFAFSPDGRTIACCHSRGTVDLWDVKAERRVRMVRFSFLRGIHSVAFAPDGQTIAASGQDRKTGKFRIDLYDLRSSAVRHIGNHADSIRSLKFSSDGRYLASGDREDAIRVWDLESGKATLVDLNGGEEREAWSVGMECISGDDGYFPSRGCVAWSPDGRMIAYTGQSREEGTWQIIADGTTGERLQRLAAGGEIVSFSPDGSLLAVSAGTDIHLVDCDTWKVKQTLTGHMQNVNGLAFSPDGKRLASASQERTLLWNVATGAPVLALPAPRKRRYCAIEFSPDGSMLAVGGSCGRFSEVRIYMAATRDEVIAGRSHPDAVPEMQLAAACRKRKEWEEAIKQYTREIDAYPEDETPWRGRARCRVETGQLDQAFQDYERVVQLWQTIGVASESLYELGPELTRLAKCYDASGQSDRALAVYRLRLQMWETNCDDIVYLHSVGQTAIGNTILTNTAISHNVVAIRLADADDSDGAIEHLLRAVELYGVLQERSIDVEKSYVPGGILRRLIGLLSEKGRMDEALKICGDVVESEPENAAAHRYLGDLLRQMGDNEAAIKAYREAIALHKSGGGPHNNLGLALKALGDLEGAVGAFERGVAYFQSQIASDPGNALARKNLRAATNNLNSTRSQLTDAENKDDRTSPDP